VQIELHARWILRDKLVNGPEQCDLDAWQFGEPVRRGTCTLSCTVDRIAAMDALIRRTKRSATDVGMRRGL